MILLAVKVPSSNKHLIFSSILFTDNQWQEAVFEKCKKRVKAHSREDCSWYEALGTPFVIGSSIYFRCKGCNHFIGQFSPGARDLRVETQTDQRRQCSANQVEMRVCFFFLEVFGENFNFWCMFFPSFFVLRRWRPFNLKPHLNLRGEHFLLFCVICPCLWENYQSHFYDTTGLMDVKYQ